jgi:hypothetical protein
MASKNVQELCAECLSKESCDYVAAAGVRLLRCLDRQTVSEPQQWSKRESGLTLSEARA